VLGASALQNIAKLPPGSVQPAGASARVVTAMQLVAEGVSLGSVYALVALGFVLLYNCASLVNFAQGDLVMFGGYLLRGVCASNRNVCGARHGARGDGAVPRSSFGASLTIRLQIARHATLRPSSSPRLARRSS